MLTLRTLCGLLALVALSASPLPAAEASRPNIVFFLADDQRYDTLGCSGHPIIQTPHIDALADQGVRFENAFVSHSICWVSRTSILTGLTARSFGRPDAPDAAKPEALAAFLPDVLGAAGYRTGFFGKWHAKMPAEFKPADHFDVFQAISRNPYFHVMPDGTKRHETDLVADGGIEFLRNLPNDQPFCLNLWFNAAHAEDGDKRPGSGHYPWPPSADGLYEDVAIAPPRLSDPAIFESQPEFLKRSINRERYFWGYDTPEKFQANMRAYFRMISGIDHAVGRVVAELERLELAENTVIVYSADNGYYLGDRGFQGKWSHYEQSMRVPMIVYDPRLPDAQRGRVRKEMVLNLDLPSTLVDWTGATVPSTYQGASLRPLLESNSNGNSPAWRADFFCEHVTLAPLLTWEGVRGERYKYARYFDQQPPYEFLHDLASDPDELKNLADDRAYATVLAEMRERCDALVEQYGGPLVPLEQRKEKRPARRQTRQQ